MSNASKECLKTLGVVARDSECPTGCGVMQIVSEKTLREGDGSRSTMEQIANQVSQQYCPSPAEMVLRRGSRGLVW